MSTLPVLKLLLDDGTGSFPYNITAWVMSTDGWSFSRGREDWAGGVSTATLSLTLNNSDGRFTPGSTLIASPSPIKVDQRIRLQEIVNGTTYTRFTGYVKSWPVAWPAVVTSFSTVTITATDAQARAERRVLRSVPEEEIMLDGPVAYYTLGEQAGATTAADSSGNQQNMLAKTGTGSYAFGVASGPSTDSLTAFQVQTGVGNSGAIRATLLASVTAFTMETFYIGTDKPGIGSGLAYNLLSAYGPVLGINENGKVVLFAGAGVVSTAVVTDGALHHIAMTHTGTTATLYIDGVSQGSVATAIGTWPATWDFTVGVGDATISFGFVAAHAAVYTSALSAARILAHYQAGTTGFTGETDVARITRILGYCGIAMGTTDTSLTNVPFVDITGSSAWDVVNTVNDAAMGTVYIDESGAGEVHSRQRVGLKTSPDLTLLATSYVTPDIQPVVDDQSLCNYFEATSQTTGVTQVARSASSETTHGRYSQSETYLVSTDAEAMDRANWIVVNFAEPTARYGTLTLNLFNMPAATASSVLAALKPDMWLRVLGLASQNTDGTTVDVVVEGYTETVTGESWQVVCNVVKRSLFNIGIYDDATYGIYDSAVARYAV